MDIENCFGGNFIQGVDDIDITNLCDEIDDGNGVVIKKSTVIVVTPQSSHRKRKQIDENEDLVEAPAVGMRYNAWMDIEVDYKKYGKQQGFGVSRVQGAKSKDKTTRRAMTWRCECYGDPEMSSQKASKKIERAMDVGGSAMIDLGTSSRRKRKSKKCFCPAMVYASVDSKDSSWIIRKAILEHENHIPKPTQAKLVKEYRMQSFHSGVRRKLLNGTDVGVSIPKIYDTMARERNGLENMEFTEKDMRHVVDKERRLKMEGGDANALDAYFDKMQRQNLNFFHAHRLFPDGTLKDVIWVDARSQVAYEEFGDVVCFDSTYLTNEYDLPFANFVGVNHHGQSMLLGCALISTEDCETYSWIFSQWLLCMKGKAPMAILTDQAAAMRRPIEEVFPKTRHRWCIWHILQKLPKKFVKYDRYDELKEELLRAIYDSLTIGDFESNWKQVIDNFSLSDNEWLTNLYDERHMWVPAFLKDYFWAGMRTTQRVESINSFFDKFIGRHTRLFEFGEKFSAVVERRVFEEHEADARDEKWIRNLSTGFAIERFFRKIYTDAKFREVQRECERVTYCFVREEKQIVNNKYTYVLEDRVWIKPKDCHNEILTNRRRMYFVEFDSETKIGMCDCKLFQTHGIVCRHLVRVLDQNFVDPIPDHYILRRWRKDVIRKHTKISVGYHDLSKNAQVKRHDKISTAMEPLYDIASVHDTTTSIVVRGIKGLIEEVKQWVKDNPDKDCQDGVLLNTDSGDGFTSVNVNVATQSSQAEACIGPSNLTPPSVGKPALKIKDPLVPKRGKGRTKTTRYKSVGEPGWKKANTSKSKSASSSFVMVEEGTDCNNEVDVNKKKAKELVKKKLVGPASVNNSKPENNQKKKKKVAIKEKALSVASVKEQWITDEHFCNNVDDEFLNKNCLTFKD